MTAPFWTLNSVSAPAASLGYARARPRPRRVAGEGVSRAGFWMGTLSVEQLDDNYDAWRDLAARSLEPNAFLEPGFALQLARHAPARSRPRFVAVWREGVHLGEARRLVGLFALAPTSVRAGRRAGPALARQAGRAGGALAGS